MSATVKMPAAFVGVGHDGDAFARMAAWHPGTLWERVEESGITRTPH